MACKETLLEKAVIPGVFAASTAAGIAYQVSQPVDPQQPIPLPFVVAQGALMGVMAPLFLGFVGLAVAPIVKFGVDTTKFGYYFIKAIPRMRVSVFWKESEKKD